MGIADAYFGRESGDNDYEGDFEPGRPSEAYFGDKDNNPGTVDEDEEDK